jgi:hypothetical protein
MKRQNVKALKKHYPFVFLLLSFMTTDIIASEVVTPSAVNDQARVIKDTHLFSEPSLSSRTKIPLKKEQTVSIIKRKGGWYQVKESQTSGWVKMFLLRFNAMPVRESKSGLNSLISSTRKPHSDLTLTTGVRGINEKDLKSSKPDFEALKQLYLLQVSTRSSKKFAKDAGLKPKKISYPKVNNQTTSKARD